MTNTGHDMFCPGTALLHDGRLLVSGGESVAHVSIYDPVAGGVGTWESTHPLAIPRAYEVMAF